MTPRQKQIHEEAKRRAENYKRCEWPLIEILQHVAREKIYRECERSSLFMYAHEILGLSEPLAHAFSAVAKAGLTVPKLNQFLLKQDLSVSKAVRLTSVLTQANADDLLAFAAKSTSAEIDKKRVELAPEKRKRTSKKPIAKGWSRVAHDLSDETLKMLERARGACVYELETGEACGSTKWTDLHHVVERCKGGTHHPSNLRTLCRFLHTLTHELSIPAEIQFAWIKEAPSLKTLNFLNRTN